MACKRVKTAKKLLFVGSDRLFQGAQNPGILAGSSVMVIQMTFTFIWTDGFFVFEHAWRGLLNIVNIDTIVAVVWHLKLCGSRPFDEELPFIDSFQQWSNLRFRDTNSLQACFAGIPWKRACRNHWDKLTAFPGGWTLFSRYYYNSESQMSAFVLKEWNAEIVSYEGIF